MPIVWATLPAGVTVPSSQPKVPGGKAVPQLEEPSRPQPSSSAAAPAWREEDALALVAQMERDEEMARALAAQDSALARQLQVPFVRLIERCSTANAASSTVQDGSLDCTTQIALVF